MERPEDFIKREGLRAAVNPDVFNVAGIIWTYQCSIACKHCLFACRPNRPRVVMERHACIEYLRVFYELPRVIHIAGGDCLLFYDAMLDMWREAQRQGIPPHFVECNSHFCKDDAITEQRFRELEDAGCLGILLSVDPYHQEFVPAERVQRAFRIGGEVWGDRNVIGNREWAAKAHELEGLTQDEAALREHVRKGAPRWVVGNAYKYLRQHLDTKPVDAFAHERCQEQFDAEKTWEFHFDPYGNVQTNCGIVVGNTRRTPPAEILTQAHISANPIVQTVRDRGPVALLQEAVAKGLEPREGYACKCELCFHARLHLRPHYPDILCPDEVYEI